MFCVPVAHSQVELASVLSHPSQLYGQVPQSGTKYAWWWEDVMCHGGVLRTASTEVFITLQVVNPDWPLRRCSLRNVWCLRSTSDPCHGYKPQTSSNYRCCGLHPTMTAQYGTHSIRLHSIGMHVFLVFLLRCLGLADIPPGREESELIHSDVWRCSRIQTLLFWGKRLSHDQSSGSRPHPSDW